MKISLMAVTLAAALPATPPAWAQAADAVEHVVVTASRGGAELREMPLHTSVLSRTDIEQSPAQTLDQLLRQLPSLLLPGAPAYTTDPTGQNIKFRGMDKKVLVLVDGMPVLDPFYTTVQWFKLPLSNIDRVEVVRGGGSSLWGNLAVGGVINIVTRRPFDDATELSASYGSRGTGQAALSKNFTLGQGLALSLSADGATSQGYNSAPGAYRAAFWPGRGPSAAHGGNLRMGLYFAPSPALSGFVRMGYHRVDEHIGDYAYGHNVQTSPDLQAALTQRFSSATQITINAYAQHVDFDKYNGAACYQAASYACGAPVSGNGASTAQQSADVLQYATSHDLNTYRERGGSAVVSHRLSSALASVQAGLDWREIAGEDAQQTYRTPSAALPAVLRVARTNDGGGRQRFIGVFSQWLWRPLAPLDVTLALREDRFDSRDAHASQTSYGNTASPVPGATTGGAVQDTATTAFDPSLSLKWTMSGGWDLRGSVYKAFRAPGLNNLYRSFGGNAITIANPLLGPETLMGRELGLDWRSQRWSLGATAFEAQVQRVVATYAITNKTPVPAPVAAICGSDYNGVPNAACPGSVSFYTNGQDQQARGLELDATWNPDARWSWSGYATLIRTHYTSTSTGDPTGQQLPLVPKGIAGGGVSWRASERWTVNTQTRYSSPMLLSALTASAPLRQGGYTVTDLGLGYQATPELRLNASLVNAFDKHYTDASANNPQSISLALPRTLTLGAHAWF